MDDIAHRSQIGIWVLASLITMISTIIFGIIPSAIAIVPAVCAAAAVAGLVRTSRTGDPPRGSHWVVLICMGCGALAMLSASRNAFMEWEFPERSASTFLAYELVSWVLLFLEFAILVVVSIPRKDLRWPPQIRNRAAAVSSCVSGAVLLLGATAYMVVEEHLAFAGFCAALCGLAVLTGRGLWRCRWWVLPLFAWWAGVGVLLLLPALAAAQNLGRSSLETGALWALFVAHVVCVLASWWACWRMKPVGDSDAGAAAP